MLIYQSWSDLNYTAAAAAAWECVQQETERFTNIYFATCLFRGPVVRGEMVWWRVSLTSDSMAIKPVSINWWTSALYVSRRLSSCHLHSCFRGCHGVCRVLCMSPDCRGIHLICPGVLGWMEGWWFDRGPRSLKAKGRKPVICFYSLLVEMASSDAA